MIRNIFIALFVLFSFNIAIAQPIPLIISTDVSIGLIDHQVGQGAQDAKKIPGEIDDGLTLAMALNLQEEGLVNILGIIPTFGNATLPAGMLATNLLVRELKQNTQIPIVQGASNPIIQLSEDPARWHDNKPISMTEAFLATCNNLGVQKMHQILQTQTDPATILALGPLTDVACLLGVHPEIKSRIKEIIMIASQLEGEPLKINNEYVQDFNFNMAPFAGAYLLTSSDNVKLTFMTFTLTGQTSNQERSMYFDRVTLPGPAGTTNYSQESLTWIHEAVEARNQSWNDRFGLKPGPFDQYALMKALHPELFKCEMGHAYIGKELAPSPKPWGRIKVNLDANFEGKFISDDLPIYKHIPGFIHSKARRIYACTDFSGEQAFQKFKHTLYDKTW